MKDNGTKVKEMVKEDVLFKMVVNMKVIEKME